MITTNKILPIEKIRFYKTITFSKIVGSIPYFAEVKYARKPSCQYKMKYDNPDFKELYLVDDEKHYPKDEIDEFILSALRNIYADAKVKTSLILFDSELESEKLRLSNMKRKKIELYARPQIDIIHQIPKWTINGVEQFNICLDFFCFPNEERFFQDSMPMMEYNISTIEKFKGFWNKLEGQVESVE